MKIAVFSRSWPGHDASGVPLVAAEQVRLLTRLGHEVSIVGGHESVLAEPLPVAGRFFVPASGSGAIYSPERIDRRALEGVLAGLNPDLVMTHAWQTSLSHGAVEMASARGIPVAMVSHGISVHPFSRALRQRARALAWSHFRRSRFPRLLRKLSALTALDLQAKSLRFYDRDLAAGFGIPVLPLANAPVNWMPGVSSPAGRNRRILVIGYFSEVKNQKAALQVAEQIPETFDIKFIGRKTGRYFESCMEIAGRPPLRGRVTFATDAECNIAWEIANSFAVLSMSITEALPVVLLEAMASGTPFVATPVGAIPSLRGGICSATVAGAADAITALASSADLWGDYAARGQQQHVAEYAHGVVSSQLRDVVEAATKPRQRPWQ